MTKKEKPSAENDNQEGATFDMYHFFSRWDVIAMIVFILAMLGIIFYHIATKAPVV